MSHFTIHIPCKLVVSPMHATYHGHLAGLHFIALMMLLRWQSWSSSLGSLRLSRFFSWCTSCVQPQLLDHNLNRHVPSPLCSTGSEVHPASYPIRTWSSVPRVDRPLQETPLRLVARLTKRKVTTPLS